MGDEILFIRKGKASCVSDSVEAEKHVNKVQRSIAVKSKIINQKTIWTENRKRVLQLLNSKRELTIPEISRELDISIPTISKNINQLEVEGLVEKAGVSSSSGGRRPMRIILLVLNSQLKDWCELF